MDINLYGQTLNFEDSDVKSISSDGMKSLYIKKNGDLFKLTSNENKKIASKVKKLKLMFMPKMIILIFTISMNWMNYINCRNLLNLNL